MKIYTAGPMAGLNVEQVMERYSTQVKRLKDMGYEVLCPMTGKHFLKSDYSFVGKGCGTNPLTTNHAIKERDRWMVGQVDVVLVDFTQGKDKVSIGSCMELAWADELKKHTVVVMEEDNIHQHSFIIDCADVIFPNIDEAFKYLNWLIYGIDVE